MQLSAGALPNAQLCVPIPLVRVWIIVREFRARKHSLTQFSVRLEVDRGTIMMTL